MASIPASLSVPASSPLVLDSPVGTWVELYTECCAVADGHRSFDTLARQLDTERVQIQFLHLLQFHAQIPGNISRTQVQNGLVTFPEGDFNVDKEIVPQILALADSLQIDEKFAFALFQTAITRFAQVEYKGMQPVAIAECLYYDERRFQLELLCTMLKFAGAHLRASPSQRFIRDFFVSSIGVEALCLHLIATLSKHSERIKSPTIAATNTTNPSTPTNTNSNSNTNTNTSNRHYAALAEEMTLLSNALVYLINAFSASRNLIARCMDFLLSVTTRLRQQPIEEQRQADFFLEPPEDVYDPIFHVASMVYIGIIRGLILNEEAPWYDPATTPALLLPGACVPLTLKFEELKQLSSPVMRFLDSYQPVSFHCGVLFAYVMNLDQKDNDVIQTAQGLLGEPACDFVISLLAEDFMFFMAQLLSMKPLKSGYNIISEIGGPMCYQMISSFMRKGQYSRLLQPHTTKPRTFFALFRFWATLFKASPKCGSMFWAEMISQPNISITLNTAADKFFSHEKYGEKIWLNFLELLANSVVDLNTAFQAYQFVDKIYMNWQYIFDSLRKYVNDFNPTMAQYAPNPSLSIAGGTPNRPLRDADIRSWVNIFQLMASVLEHNETIRVLMAEQGHAIILLFQFLMCPVPIILKAKIVSALSSFAMSDRVYTTIWEYLDQSELVVQTASVGQLRRREGLVFELSSTESTQQEYPLTRAFLRLMSELIQWPLPTNLGVGKRAPGATGLQPYLSFVCNEVFVKFSARAYTNLSEMWSIASECLSIMLTLLATYKYKEQDATDRYTDVSGRNVLLPRPPAFLLINEICYGREIFSRIVYIIEQGATKLRYDTSSDRSYVQTFETAVELSLEVLIKVFEHIEMANLPFNLGQHLVAGAQPCAIHLAKLVGYKSVTRIPLLAVELLSCLTKTPYGLARMFYAHEESIHLIKAMALQLESKEVETVSGEELTSVEGIHKTKLQDQREGSLKLVIARFLLENITREKPNVAQFYLGLISDFEEPKLADNECFTAILAKMREPAEFCNREPQLAEAYYELLYMLCADAEFCDVALETLRDTKNDFFRVQLARIPSDHPSDIVNATYEIYSKAWLMKLVAIEMYTAANNRSYIDDLLRLLFSSEIRHGEAHEMMVSHKELTQRAILQHLIVLEQPSQELPALKLQYFQSVTRYEAPTRTTNFRGTACTDLPFLVECLKGDAMNFNGGGNGTQLAYPGSSLAMVESSHKTVEGEMYEILNYFRVANANDNLFHGKSSFFGAWKQLVETVIYSCSSYFPTEARIDIVTELLECVLNWTTNSDGAPYLSMMCSLIATLMGRLKLDKSNSVSLSDYDQSGKYTPPSGSLLKIFHQLLVTLSRPGTSRILRGYLYAAIIDYLTITEVTPDTSALLASQNNSTTWFLEDIANYYKRNKQDNYETLREVGFGYLLELIATDAAGSGVDPWRAVALALLDKMLRYDDKTRSDIARFLDERGFLRTVIDFESIGNNGGIVQILSNPGDSQPEQLLYLGKISFLMRMAQTAEGANLLRENFILEKIVNCKFIDYAPAPDLDKQIARERYEAMLNPFLELCIAMLKQHRHNKEFVGEFIMFLDTHSEVLAQLIRERKFGEHHKLLSAVFYLLCGQQELLSHKLKTKQARFHAHLLQMLHVFKVKLPWQCFQRDNTGDQAVDIKLSLDILNNLLNYCICFTAQGASNLIFAPSMKADSNSSLKESTPTMSVLGYILSNAIAQHSSLANDIATLRHHSQHSGSIPDHVLAELDPTLELPEDLTTDQRELYIVDFLYAKIASRDADLTKIFTILEATLLLLWRHLNHYLHSYKTPQQLYYQNYYQPTLPKHEDQSIPGGHALQDSDIARLRDESRNFLYSHRDTNLLSSVSSVCTNKKGGNVDVLIQKIKELLREPPPLVNR